MRNAKLELHRFLRQTSVGEGGVTYNVNPQTFLNEGSFKEITINSNKSKKDQIDKAELLEKKYDDEYKVIKGATSTSK